MATGTVLTASLLLGGANLADSRPNTAAMDRGHVPSCQGIEHRLDNVGHQLERLEGRLSRLQAQLADAQAHGQARRARVLQAQISRTQRAIAAVGQVRDRLLDQQADFCEEDEHS
jgi:hypothetical protein